MLYVIVFPVNPTPKQAGAGTESPSDLPSHLDYPIILEQPTLEEGKNCCVLIYENWVIFCHGKFLHAYSLKECVMLKDNGAIVYTQIVSR